MTLCKPLQRHGRQRGAVVFQQRQNFCGVGDFRQGCSDHAAEVGTGSDQGTGMVGAAASEIDEVRIAKHR
ncbi:hypothetical protein D3C87_2140880 [compost metagenome]